jgi:multidrug resistance efflux pump
VRDAEARLSSAGADLDSAVAEARLQEAPASAAEIDAARAAAGVSAAEKDLDDATLRAPAAGTVARVTAEVGEIVAGSRVGALDELRR